MNACMFAYIHLPSSIPLTIVEKLSSDRIISAASLATSVPEPIAIPMLACRRAGLHMKIIEEIISERRFEVLRNKHTPG